MGYFVFLNGPYAGGRYRCNGNRFAIQCDKLHFERFAVLMDVQDRPNISGLEAFSWKITRQNDSVMFLDHGLSWTGYVVISRGSVESLSRIQMVRMIGVRPSDVSKVPSIA